MPIKAAHTRAIGKTLERLMICSGHIQRGGKAVAGFLSAKSREFQVTRIEFSVDSIRMLKIEPQLAARRAAFALSPLGMLIPILPRYREPK